MKISPSDQILASDQLEEAGNVESTGTLSGPVSAPYKPVKPSAPLDSEEITDSGNPPEPSGENRQL